MSKGVNVQGEMSISSGSLSVPRCIGVVNRNRRRSTSCITLTTAERVVAECTKFITHWLLRRKKIADWINKNWLPRQRPLSDRNPISQQSSTPITLYQLRKFRDDRSRYSRTCWNNWARTSSKNRKYFRHLEVTRSLKMTRANTCDFYSTSKATITPISFVSFIYSQTSAIPASS